MTAREKLIRPVLDVLYNVGAAHPELDPRKQAERIVDAVLAVQKKESRRMEAGTMPVSWTDDLRELERLRKVEQAARDMIAAYAGHPAWAASSTPERRKARAALRAALDPTR